MYGKVGSMVDTHGPRLRLGNLGVGPLLTKLQLADLVRSDVIPYLRTVLTTPSPIYNPTDKNGLARKARAPGTDPR